MEGSWLKKFSLLKRASPGHTPEYLLRHLLLADFRSFLEYFFLLKEGESYIVKRGAPGRNHVKIIIDHLMRVYNREIFLLNINIPPSFGKTTLVTYFIAWCFAKDASCRFLYTTYGTKFAEKKSVVIRDIILLPEFNCLFGVQLKGGSRAKTDFETTAGGSLIARGFGAGITGHHARASTNGFRGCIVIDDPIKTSDANSDAIREEVNDAYYKTIFSRGSGRNIPIISICQRTHPNDIVSVYQKESKKRPWHHVVLPARFEDGELLDERLIGHDQLDTLHDNQPHVYWLQYMQQVMPDEYYMFSRVDFKYVEYKESDVKHVFITGDLAETENKNNDASAFTAWALCEREYAGSFKDVYLVMIGCSQVWLEFNGLIEEFWRFYASIKEKYGEISGVHIEDKSVGVALNSILRLQPGVCVKPIKRESKMSKKERIARVQPYVRNGKMRLLYKSEFVDLVLDHMCKITKHKSVAKDDIADTVADAVYLGLISGHYSPAVKPRRHEFTKALKPTSAY